MHFQGWGTSLAWWTNINYDPLTQNILSNLIFGKMGLGFNIARYNLGGGSHPIFPQTNMRPGGMVPCLKHDSHSSFNFSNDPFQIAFLDKAVQLNVDYIELFANSPPWWMTTNNKTSGSSFLGTTNLPTYNEQAFAQFLVDSFYFVKSRYTSTITFSLSPFNEPSNPFWYYNPNNNGSQEGCFFTVPAQNRILKHIKTLESQHFGQSSSNIILSSPDEFTSSFALATYMLSPKNILDKVNVHGYSFTFRNHDFYLDTDLSRRLLRKATLNKPLWMSEFGMGGNDTIQTALQLGRHIFRDLQTYSPQAWIYWQAVESSSNEGWGLIHIPFDNPTFNHITIRKQYWIMKHFTHTLQKYNHYHIVNSHVIKVTNVSQVAKYIILNDTPNPFVFSPPEYLQKTMSSFFFTDSLNNYQPLVNFSIFEFPPFSIHSVVFTSLH
jgi:hypothetical protein